jgi:hypothetical protein
MVNDFEFIQLFGGNRVPIDEGRKIRRKSQKERSDLNIIKCDYRREKSHVGGISPGPQNQS